MSVFEDLEALQKRVDARLQELEPLVAEFHRLQELAERLSFELLPAGDAAPEAASPKRTARRAPKPAPAPAKTSASRRRRAPKRAATAASAAGGRQRAGGTRATGRERRERVLELITSRPGITVPEIGRELAVEPPPLYRVVRKLLAEGVVSKEGKNLRLT